MKVFITTISVLLLCICSAGFAQKPKDDDALERIFNRAMQALQAGAYPEAERDLREILHSEPDNPAALVNLGVLYSRTHRYTEAADAYKHALRMVPAQESVQLDLGLAYLKQNAYEQALPYFSHLHDLHPENAQFAILTATCLAYTGKALQAIDLLQAADRCRRREPCGAVCARHRLYTGQPTGESARCVGPGLRRGNCFPGKLSAGRGLRASD